MLHYFVFMQKVKAANNYRRCKAQGQWHNNRQQNIRLIVRSVQMTQFHMNNEYVWNAEGNNAYAFNQSLRISLPINQLKILIISYASAPVF